MVVFYFQLHSYYLKNVKAMFVYDYADFRLFLSLKLVSTEKLEIGFQIPNGESGFSLKNSGNNV